MPSLKLAAEAALHGRNFNDATRDRRFLLRLAVPLFSDACLFPFAFSDIRMVPQPIRHTKSILWSVRSHQDTAKILKTFMGAFAAWIETVRTGANSHGFGAFLQKRDAIARDFVNGDSAALEKIVAQQDPATFFSPSGDIEQGAAKVASIHKKSARMFSKPGKSELEILQHDASGDLAFWTGLQRRRGAAGPER